METRTRYPITSFDNASTSPLVAPTPGDTVISVKKSRRAKSIQDTVQPTHEIGRTMFRVSFGTNVVKLWHMEWPLSATGHNLYEAEQQILAQAADLAESVLHAPLETLDKGGHDLREFLFDVL